MDQLIKKIKEKKELKGLPDSLVKSTLENYLSKNKIKDISSSKSEKMLIKEIRSKLRIYTGQYTPKKGTKDRNELLNRRDFLDILKTHTSTRERIKDYQFVKEIVQELNPKVIIDLGCGINPIAIANNNMEYHAYDINEEDLKIVHQFFKIKGINGHVYHSDIRDNILFPKSDLCLMFKLLDILGDKRFEVTSNLLTRINSKIFMISFATRTLTGKPMNSPYRRWFEKILNNLKLNYKVKRMSNELFYIVEKKS